MTMQTLYTANGNLIRRRTKDGVVPVIRVCRDEYEVDQQELLLWALLNWRIVSFAQIGPLYEKAKKYILVFDGPTPLYVYFEDTKKLMLAPTSMRVDVNDVLLRELCKVLGKANVAFVKE